MKQYQGLRVEIREVGEPNALKEYRHDYFHAPRALMSSRLVQEESGIQIEVVLTADRKFPIYRAEALIVDVTFHSLGEFQTQTYLVPVPKQHGGFEIILRDWLQWDHSKPDDGPKEASYKMPMPTEGCIVVDISRGKRKKKCVVTQPEDRGCFVPPTVPHFRELKALEPVAIDEDWFELLKSDNDEVLWAEFRNLGPIHDLELEEETREVGPATFVTTEDESDPVEDAISVSAESSEDNARTQPDRNVRHSAHLRHRGHSESHELVQPVSTQQLRRSSRKRTQASMGSKAEPLHADSTESEEDSVKHYNPRKGTTTGIELLDREPIESLVAYNRRKARSKRMSHAQPPSDSTSRRARKQVPLEYANDSDGSVVSCAPNSHLKRPRAPTILLDEDDEPENQLPNTPQATPSVARRHIRAAPTPKTQNIPTVLEVDAETTPPAMAARGSNTREHPPSVGKNCRPTAEPVSKVIARVAIPVSAPYQAVLAAKKRKRAEIGLELQALEVQQKQIALKKQLLELEDD